MAHILYLHYIFNDITYMSSDYRKTKLLNALIRCSIYSEYFMQFIPCGTKVPSFYLNARRVAHRGVLDDIRDESRA